RGPEPVPQVLGEDMQGDQAELLSLKFRGVVGPASVDGNRRLARPGIVEIQPRSLHFDGVGRKLDRNLLSGVGRGCVARFSLRAEKALRSNEFVGRTIEPRLAKAAAAVKDAIVRGKE